MRGQEKADLFYFRAKNKVKTPSDLASRPLKEFFVYFNVLIIFVYTYTFYHQIYCPIYETGN